MSSQMNIVRDPVDDLLKADAATNRDGYIDDGGFTLKVMDALPVRRQVSPAMRFAIPFGFTLVAALAAVLFTGGGNFFVDAAMDIATSTLTQTAVAFFALVGLMLLVSIAAASDN